MYTCKNKFTYANICSVLSREDTSTYTGGVGLDNAYYLTAQGLAGCDAARQAWLDSLNLSGVDGKTRNDTAKTYIALGTTVFLSG